MSRLMDLERQLETLLFIDHLAQGLIGKMLYGQNQIQSSQHLWNECFVIIPIVKMKKLQYTQEKQHAKGYTLVPYS